MKVGDLVEYFYTFDSNSIDPWTAGKKICFVSLGTKDDHYVWAQPQVSLNEQGESVLAIARDSEYPGTRDGYWLLESKKCRVINGLL